MKTLFETKRRIVQTASLLLLHSSWGPEAKWFCNPVLSCHSCSLSWFACPIGVFIHYSGYQIFPFLAAGTVLLLGILFGRLFCGWVCPFGLLQDLLHKIPSPKFTLPRWSCGIKYVILVLMVFVIPFLWGEQTLFSFCRICPSSAIQVTLPSIISDARLALRPATLVKLLLLVAILLLATVSRRGFCKTMCPIGALLGPLNTLAFWKVRPPTDDCVSCGKCDKVCPTDAAPASRVKEGSLPSASPECVLCHECQSVCPQRKRD